MFRQLKEYKQTKKELYQPADSKEHGRQSPATHLIILLILIKKAIECKEPYGHAVIHLTALHILHNFEQDTEAQARNKAIELFLAYCHDGEES
ncbi:hypothetical protein QUF70_01745 [Desulfobacterales bacterium HSG17]|nr:hypothetical protein [Desulfobacterales bacterium HSG17]